MADEAETWRSLRSDVLDYGRAYSSKPEKGIHGKRVAPRAFGSSPRAAGHLSGSPRAAGHLSGSPRAAGHLSGSPRAAGHLSGSPRAAGHLSGSPRAAGHLSGSPRAAGHLSGSPGEFSRAGQKSHRELGDGFRKCSPSELHRSQGESWRERPSGHAARWRKDSARQEGEDLGRPLEEGTRWKQKKAHVSQEAGETVIHASGRKRRMRKRDHGEVEEDGEAPVTNVSSLSEGELVCLRAEERIGRDEIYRVKRHPGNSPKTWYSCGLCDVLLDSVAAAHKHMKEKWHKKRAKERREEVMLTEILPPGQQQVQDVGSAIQKEVEEVGLSEEDVERRHSVVSSMEEVVRSVLPDCTLRLYGSSCTRFGFKGSDVNIDIQFPSHMHQPDVLLLIQESLSSSSLYVNLEADFHARVPVVVCTEKQSGLVCKVSAGNDSAYLTTAYLSALSKLEPLLLPLVIAFRRWAQICHVDRPEEGGLPPYVVSLMVVYFLQQRKEPLLPAYLGPWIPEFSLNKLVDFRLTGVENGQVLWEYSPSPAEATPSSERFLKKGKSSLVFEPEGRGSAAVGQVWVEMLRFYSLECDMADRVISVRINSVFSRESKDWPKKRIAVEDPFSVKRNVARSLNSQLMYDYILHCLRTAYKYFALPLSQQSVPRTNRSSHLPLSDARLVQSELGKLSLSPRVANGRPGEEDGGPALQEDADCVVEEVIEDPDERRPLEDEENEDVDPTHLPHFPREEQEAVSVTSSDSDSGSTDDPPAESNKGPSFESNQSEEEEDEDEGGRGRPHLDSCTTEEEQYLPDAASGEDLLSEDEGSRVTHAVRQEDVLETPGLAATVPAEHLRYEFNKQVFTRGKSHAIVCSLCKHDGHLKRDCPEDFKRVELDPLPPMTPKFLRVLNEVCIQCYRDFAPDDIEVRVREHILQDLEKFVRHQFEGAKLRLFGSSKNGFGFKQSDLDICMVLEGQETSEGLDCIGIIDGLARVLRKHTGLRNILPITTAKVPIVKFFHVRTGLEGDISLYNTLALHNTRLLASYAAIDPRVKHLCYVMKVFAKVCDIGDASRGSLSSYAYTLMVLFFLQQRKPPVIPVLQEIYDGQKKPEILVDGWNVYFFHRLEDLSQRWPEYRTNKESLGELWLGLLQFYTQEFDFREHVVSIRRHQLLTTFKKQWTSKYIVIEDPFDLNHNLGAGLSRRMTNFIMKAFINGRRVFGTPIKVFPSEYSSKMEYFFDPEVLTEGQLAPNDRCCRICGKIGHFMKDCPMRRKVRQKRDQYEDGWRRYGDQEREWPENQEGGRNRTPRQADRRRRREEKRCFLCGSHAHIKKECPHYKGSAGSPFSPSPSTSSHMKNFRERQVSPQQLEEKKKQKQPKVILSPQAGSLANRHTTQGRSTPKGSPLD